MNRLLSKRCIVTGAGDGIGRGIALALGKEGASVAICDINDVTLKETERLLVKAGVENFSKVFDLRDIGAIASFIDEAAGSFGGIDVLVTNAAVMPGSRLEQLDVSTVDEILEVNLRAPIFFTKYASEWMKKSNGGSIIHMSSVTGHNGFPEVSVYGATKGALISLARGHAMELAPFDIRVNTVSPGTVDSPMLHRFVAEHAEDPEKALRDFDAIHPRGKVASIEEVANVFIFLACDESANITGTDIRCDGGYAIQGTQPK